MHVDVGVTKGSVTASVWKKLHAIDIVGKITVPRLFRGHMFIARLPRHGSNGFTDVWNRVCR